MKILLSRRVVALALLLIFSFFVLRDFLEKTEVPREIKGKFQTIHKSSKYGIKSAA